MTMTAPSLMNPANLPNLDDVLQSVQEGYPLDEKRLLQLAQINDPSALTAMAQAAGAVAQTLHGGTLSYQNDMALLFTNRCEMCPTLWAYPKTPEDPGGFVLTVDTLMERLETARQAPVSQLLLTGGMDSTLRIPGLEAPATLKQYGKLVAFVHEHLPQARILGFSPDEIDFLQVVSDRSAAYILAYFKDMGMGALGGHGADLLVDPLRLALSPKKMRVRDWWNIMAEAVRQELAVTLSMTVGHGEQPAHRVDHLLQLRDFLHQNPEAVLSITPFIAWNPQAPWPPPARKERLHALSLMRLALGLTPTPLEPYWTAAPLKETLEEVQECLQSGATTVGGLASAMLARFLAGQSDVAAQLPEALPPAALAELIEDTGYQALRG
jgi:cyclic dehypoxanthinyl futalosine synthase